MAESLVTLLPAELSGIQLMEMIRPLRLRFIHHQFSWIIQRRSGQKFCKRISAKSNSNQHLFLSWRCRPANIYHHDWLAQFVGLQYRIYAKGPNADANYPYKGANFWQDWTKPAAIEYYDKDKIRQFHSNGEIAVYGNYSRAKPQKSLEITLSDRFGEGNFNFPLIPDKAFIDKTDNIVLRNSSNRLECSSLRDAFMERVMKNTFRIYRNRTRGDVS